MDQNDLKKERDILIQKINILEAEYKSAGKNSEERKACISTLSALRKELNAVQVQKIGAMSLHRQHGQLISRTQR